MENVKDKKLVMVFGTFDYLHAGHENLFSQARELGDEIIAVMARDKTVKTIKGALPDHNEKNRMQALEETAWANKVVLGDLKDKTKVIKNYKPDIIALGYDQFAFTYLLDKMIIELKLETKIVRLKPYRPDMYKSSIIKYNLSQCKPNPHETNTLIAQPD
ncbi:adenylyltransferase/cytidyltransferase family protein [Candidatus Gracilibacteria bacterium]|jgi:FAD synthetase|nr:adenylyltransferase/cytidyltransferase family protein [Candidatus Gracilibacteria bacterium]